MKKNSFNIILEEQKNDFLYKKDKLKLNITFNRISFIFFIFFIISVIYSIHLTHLGSRKISEINSFNLELTHIHPNNFGSTKFINNINIPSLLEFTFINNKLVKTRNKIQKTIPHPLDKKNNPLKKDIALPDCFYR